MEKIEKYANEIPEEIRNMIAGLDNDYRTAIFVALYKDGELSFSELLNELGISKAKLNYHLGKLMESGLVHHYFKHELGAENYSFYNISALGQSFFENLNQLLNPINTIEQPFEGYTADDNVQVVYVLENPDDLDVYSLQRSNSEVLKLLDNSTNNSNLCIGASFTKLKEKLLREYSRSTQSNPSVDSTS